MFYRTRHMVATRPLRYDRVELQPGDTFFATDIDAAYFIKTKKAAPLEGQAETMAAPEVQAEAAPEVQAEAAPEAQAEAAPEVQAEAAPEVQAEAAPEVQAEAAPEVQAEAAPEAQAEAAPELPVDETPPPRRGRRSPRGNPTALQLGEAPE